MNTRASDGASIAWSEFGLPDGPAIILLHSLGSDGAMWSPQIRVLAERYRVLAVDMRGHGRSDTTSPPYPLDRLGSDVLAVADAAAVERFHVCGLSIGGQMALWLAANHADRLRSVTAANTGAKIGDETSWGQRIEAITSGGMGSIRDAVLSRWFSPDFPTRHPDWFAAAGATFDHTEQAGYIGGCTALASTDLRAVVPEIDLAALVIGGTLDVSTPPTQAQWLHEHISGSRLEIIEGAAHLSNLDRAETFTGHLLTFLDQT